MTSALPGTDILAVKITHISRHGVWVLLDDEELFMPFEAFPWFRHAEIGKILDVERPSPNHLYWPELDIDLSVDSIRRPERFPLAAH